MVLNCTDANQILNILLSKEYITFMRGSRMYGNANANSDYDFGVIVPDDFDFIDVEGFNSCEKADKRIHNCVELHVLNTKGVTTSIDVQIVKESEFIELIQEHTPFALEAIFSRFGNRISEYRKYFNLDTWKLRESFGSVANNSWAKAHKKMTVEADLDMYCGVKSLFHSIRLQKLACQIAVSKPELDFKECSDLWNDLMNDLANGKDWDYYKEKYKPLYNDAHSEMVKVCPKPEEKFKKPKK